MPKILKGTTTCNLVPHQKLDVVQDSVKIILKASFNLDSIPFNFFERGDLLVQNMECFTEILSDLRPIPKVLDGKRYFATFAARKVGFDSSSVLYR